MQSGRILRITLTVLALIPVISRTQAHDEEFECDCCECDCCDSEPSDDSHRTDDEPPTGPICIYVEGVGYVRFEKYPVDPAEYMPGLPPAVDTNDKSSIEPFDGFGAFLFATQHACYVSATFDRTYAAGSAVGMWHFAPPSLTNAGVNPSTNIRTYNARYNGMKFRSYDMNDSTGIGTGRNDSRNSNIVRNAGNVTVWDITGRGFEFNAPSDYQTTNINKVLIPGGSRVEYDYTGGPLYEARVFLKDSESPGSGRYVRLYRYTWNASGQPATIEERVAKATVPEPWSYNSNQWATLRTTTFVYHQSGYADSTTGDLVAIDVVTNLSKSGEQSFARTVFKYHAGSALGDQHQLRAIIRPSSYRAYVIEQGITPDNGSQVFTASYSSLLNYLDQEMEYYPSSWSIVEQRLRLRKLVARNLGAGCGCAGTTPGTFWYSYTYRSPPPFPIHEWRSQVTIKRGPTEGTAPVYKYIDYNPYGKKIVEATVDPSNSSRRHIRKWEYSSLTGYLTRVFYPSNCTGYNPSTHQVTHNPNDGLMYYIGYSGSNDYITQLQFGSGSSSPVTLWTQNYVPQVDPGNSSRRRYVRVLLTRYQPDPILTTYSHNYYATDAIALTRRTTTRPSVYLEQNGDNTQHAMLEYFDLVGRRTWLKDEAGSVQHTEYQLYENSTKRTIQDVNTSLIVPPLVDFNNTYITQTKLHLQTEYETDDVGRVKKITDPLGVTRRILHTRLANGEEVLLTFDHVPAGGAAAGAVHMDVSYQGRQIRETATGALDPTVTDSMVATLSSAVWDSTNVNVIDGFTGGSIQSRTASLYTNGYVTTRRRFIDASNPNITNNTYDTTYGYDNNGNVIRLQDPPDGTAPGTITRYSYNFLSRLVATSVGTSDSGPSWNLRDTEVRYYDHEEPGGGGTGLGDGKLTRVVQKIDLNTANDRTTNYVYSNLQEGRLIKTVSPTLIIEIMSYLRPGWASERKLYAGVEAASNLREWTKMFYDTRGRVFEERTIPVNQTTGATNEGGGDFNTVQYWRDQRGDIVKTRANGSLLLKDRYDGAGRIDRQTISRDQGESGYAASTDLTLAFDYVVTQRETVYDAASNPIILKTLDRQSDYNGTGLLTHGSPTQSRGHYIVSWYDNHGREIRVADYGNNDDQDILQQPVPMPNDSNETRLLSKKTYNPDGSVSSSTDPEAITTSYVYDDLGHLTSKTENSTGAAPWANRVTDYAYTPIGQIRTITASSAGPNPGANPPADEPQVTTYTYGVNPTQEGGSVTTIYSNRLLYQMDYPRSDSGPDQDNLGYNLQGELTYKRDAAGNKHTYTYNAEGSLRSDQVSTLSAGFDGTVRSIWRTYDGIGRLSKVTSRSSTTEVSSALNGVLYEYEKYGLVSKIYQNITGDATTSSLYVGYTYNYPSYALPNVGIPGLRLSQTRSPYGVIINDDYSAGTNDYYLNRPSGRSSSGVTMFANSYLGADRVITKTYAQAGVDRIVGLDRFGRVSTLAAVRQDATVLNSYEYGYNFNDQVTYRKEFTASSEDKSEAASYNGLWMLKEFRRGWHSPDGSISDPNLVYGQAWNSTPPPAIDHSGNSRKEGTYNGGWTYTAQTFNKSNEITQRAGDSTFATYDANGNRLTAWNLQYKYDAWNRLVEVRGYKPTYLYQLLRFAYNGLHQKIRKDQYYAPNPTGYYYDSQSRVIEELNPNTSMLINTYAWGTEYIDEIVGRRNSSGIWEYYIQDSNYNTVTRMANNGSIIARYTYSAYGSPAQLSADWLTGTSIVEDLYLFSGREYHQIAGLYDYRSRAYDPGLGIYINRDVGGIWYDKANYGNGYSYIGSDPLNGVDPSGFAEQKDDWTSAGPKKREDFPLKSNVTDGPLLADAWIKVIIVLKYDTVLTKDDEKHKKDGSCCYVAKPKNVRFIAMWSPSRSGFDRNRQATKEQLENTFQHELIHWKIGQIVAAVYNKMAKSIEANTQDYCCAASWEEAAKCAKAKLEKKMEKIQENVDKDLQEQQDLFHKAVEKRNRGKKREDQIGAPKDIIDAVDKLNEGLKDHRRTE